MVDTIKKGVEKCDVEAFIRKLIDDDICEEIKKKTQKIHPLRQVYIYKVKVLKRPKQDSTILSISMVNPFS